MGRKESHARAAPAYDLANPPEGARLNLGSVAVRLGVTVSDMAAAAGISRTAIADLLTNKWPVRTDPGAIRTALRTLLEASGATDAELLALFHAHDGRNPVFVGDGTAPPPRAPQPTLQRSRTAPTTPLDEEPEMLLPKQSLSPHARRHFKLFTNPFDGEVISDEQMFVGDDIAYCREALWQCVQNGGFVALVGESGAGKTTLLQDLEARLLRTDRSVLVIRPGVLGMEGNDTKGKAIKSADILHAIISQLDPQAVMPQTLQARTVKAAKLLISSAQIGNTHLLVVEEAHSMPNATLKHLKRLHEMRLGRKPLLGILLLAQTELKANLAAGMVDGTLREVAQRCEIVELLPLDSGLKAYLQRRAAAHSLQLEQLIDDDAVEQLRARLTFKRKGTAAISMCYPLAVNNLLTLAMNRAAEIGAPCVTRDIVGAL